MVAPQIRQRPEPTTDYEPEIEAAMRLLTHPHLMKALMAYGRDGKHSIIFPWAQGGNLRDAWVVLERRRRLSKDGKLLLWVLTELRGLAWALETLHRKNWRHGDLKPENILCFESSDEDKPFTLKLADMGLAKFHKDNTQHRRQGTTTTWATWRYEPPESLSTMKQPRSRRADVWSFGCIVVEFLVWYLYGRNELDLFGGAFTAFCSVTSNETLVIDPVVCHWIDRMRQDPRCGPDTALGYLLKILRTRLLIPASPSASTMVSVELASQPDSVTAPASEVDTDPTSNRLPTIKVIPSTFAFEGKLAQEPAGRADSREIRALLEEIVDRAKSSESARKI